MSRSRSKLDTSPINYDEVVDSPSLQGMVSFLSVQPGAVSPLDFSIPVEGISETGTPDTGIVAAPVPLPAVPLASPRIRVAETARDGHSLGEQALYEALWRHAQPNGVLTAGYRTLAGLARLTVNNCKANLQSLTAKLAIEEIAGFSYTQGRSYRVYSEDEVLRRRRSAGLTHFIKTRGVQFVDPYTGVEKGVAPLGVPETGTPSQAAPPAGHREGH